MCYLLLVCVDFNHPGSGILTIRVYRLISAVDGNLPNKPCQTCKNSFHASCLYEVRVFYSPRGPIVVQLTAVVSHTVVQEQSLVELPPLSFKYYQIGPGPRQNLATRRYLYL